MTEKLGRRRVVSGIFIGLAALSVVLVMGNSFLNESFADVKGDSMEPTLSNGDFWTGKRCYKFWSAKECSSVLKRGDIVTFRPPNSPVNDLFVKRIVGLPLEEVITWKGSVYINKRILNEPYLLDIEKYPDACQFFKLSEKEYFVLGDNRSHSEDSRSFGPIKIDEIEAYTKFDKYNEVQKTPFFGGKMENIGGIECLPK